MDQFVDLSTGVERPGSIANVERFMDDIKSEWLKLDRAQRAATYDPTMIDAVKRELNEGFRDFVMSKFLAQVSGPERDISGELVAKAAQMSKWIGRNRDLLRRLGVFTNAQLSDIEALGRTGKMIQRGYELGKPVGSPTYTRLVGGNFVDAFLTPFTSWALGIGIGGTLGLLSGQGGLGVLFGAETGFVGADILRSLYAMPKQQALEWLNRGIRDPQIAADLAKKATAANASKFSNATKAWIRSVIASQPAAQAMGVYGPGSPAGASP